MTSRYARKSLPVALPCGKNVQYSCLAMEQSAYFLSLNADAKKRYSAKVSLIGGIDPYALKQHDMTQEIRHLPLIRYRLQLLSYM